MNKKESNLNITTEISKLFKMFFSEINTGVQIIFDFLRCILIPLEELGGANRARYIHPDISYVPQYSQEQNVDMLYFSLL